METYTTSFESKYYQLESRAWLINQRIGFTNGERTSKVIEYEGRYRIKSNKGSGGPQGIWCEHRYSTRGGKNARRSVYRNNWLTQLSNAKELWSPNQKIRSSRSDQGWISWIDLGVQPTAIWWVDNQLMLKNDVWAGRMNSRIWLRIASIRTCWINGLKMIVAKDANKITRLLGLIPM